MESVISGATAGIIVSVAVGLFGWVRHQFRRRRQLVALQSVVSQAYSQYTRLPETHNMGWSLREVAYRALDSAMSSYMESWTPDLRFDEKYQIERAFVVPRHMVEHYGAPVGTGAFRAFNGLLNVKALRLKYEPLAADEEFKKYLIEEIPNSS